MNLQGQKLDYSDPKNGPDTGLIRVYRKIPSCDVVGVKGLVCVH